MEYNKRWNDVCFYFCFVFSVRSDWLLSLFQHAFKNLVQWQMCKRLTSLLRPLFCRLIYGTAATHKTCERSGAELTAIQPDLWWTFVMRVGDLASYRKQTHLPAAQTHPPAPHPPPPADGLQTSPGAERPLCSPVSNFWLFSLLWDDPLDCEWRPVCLSMTKVPAANEWLHLLLCS